MTMENKKITVAQLATHESGGMCYAIHLSDGTFIVIDGGEADSDGTMSYVENSMALKEHLRALSGEEKPVISAWFITHFHLDHVDMATRFIREEQDNFTVKLFAYNSAGSYESCDESRRLALWEEAISLYPEAEKRILKTGEVYEFAGASLKVLMAEDFKHHDHTPSQNTISAAFMIKFDSGRKFAVLGDCDTKRLGQMLNPESTVYQTAEELKCDILQVPHHGLPLGSKEFIDKNVELYKIMEPEICFFPVNEERYITDKKFFDNPFYADNYYLLTTRGERCYHNSKTVTVDIEDLTVI